MAGDADMPQATNKLEFSYTSKPAQRKQSKISDITKLHTYYMGTPGTKIYGYDGYVKVYELIHGPNAPFAFSEPQLANVRTGQLGQKTHHCGLKEDHNHKPGPECIPKGHFAFCHEWKTMNGYRVRCGMRYCIWSRKGCPDCGNRPGTVAKVVEDLYEDHISEVDWEVFNDPTRSLILKHQENSEQVELSEVEANNNKKLDEWYSSPKAETEEAPHHLMTPWTPYVQTNVNIQQQSRMEKARAKRIQTLAHSIVAQETQRTMATKKTKKNRVEDPVAAAKLRQDALESATAQVIAEDLQAQQPVVSLSGPAQARLNRRRGIEAKFTPGGSGTSKPKGGNKKATPADQEQPTDKKEKKGKKPKRDQENQPLT